MKRITAKPQDLIVGAKFISKSGGKIQCISKDSDGVFTMQVDLSTLDKQCVKAGDDGIRHLRPAGLKVMKLHIDITE